MALQPGPGGPIPKTAVLTAAAAAKLNPKPKPKPTAVVVKAKPLTVKQQAIQQVQAVNQASMAQVNQTAAKAMKDAKAQAQQALGFEHALNEITQGDAGRIYDAYGNAADKVSAYGNLALASTGDSSRSAAEQAQNYLASVGPDVGAETRPDIAGALRALGATAVGDVAGDLASQGAYAQERARQVRNAQLMRLSDIGANAMFQGADRAGQLRSDELARASGSRQADVDAAIRAINEEGRAKKTEIRAEKGETRAQAAERRAQGEYAREGTLATNTEKRAAAAEARAKAEEGRAVTGEERAADDQRMKDLAFDVELQQRKVDLAAAKLANATGEIAKKKAQFELDNAQKVLDASLAQQSAETAGTRASTAGTEATTANTKAQTAATKLETAIAKKTGGKTLTPYEQAQIMQSAHDEAKEMFSPPPPKNPLAPKPQRTNYKDAMNRLMGKYGLTKMEATNVLDVYYKTPGVDGRPVFDPGEQAQLLKLGFTKAEINQASNGYGKAKRTGVRGPGYTLFERMLDRLGGGGKFGDVTGGSIFGGNGPGG